MSTPLRHKDPKRIRILLETMLYALVDNETSVLINEVRGEHNIVFEVTVDERDVGHVIGQGGKNAEAMRTVLKGACKKLSVKYNLDIITKDRHYRSND